MGFLAQWPTMLTVVMFPLLAWMCRRLGLADEREMERLFDDEGRAYAERTPRFLPIHEIRTTHA